MKYQIGRFTPEEVEMARQALADKHGLTYAMSCAYTDTALGAIAQEPLQYLVRVLFRDSPESSWEFHHRYVTSDRAMARRHADEHILDSRRVELLARHASEWKVITYEDLILDPGAMINKLRGVGSP